MIKTNTAPIIDLKGTIDGLMDEGSRAFVWHSFLVRIQAYTLVTAAQIVGASWDEFDLENAIWTIPGKRMKLNMPHLVPLSERAVSLLEALKLHTGPSPYLCFPSMSKETHCNSLPEGEDGESCFTGLLGHKYRAYAFSTLINYLGYNQNVVSAQFAHAGKELVDLNAYIDQRKAMMEDLADLLDDLEIEKM